MTQIDPNPYIYFNTTKGFGHFLRWLLKWLAYMRSTCEAIKIVDVNATHSNLTDENKYVKVWYFCYVLDEKITDILWYIQMYIVYHITSCTKITTFNQDNIIW